VRAHAGSTASAVVPAAGSLPTGGCAVLTDWLIVRRLAAELERSLRGTRIRAAGTLGDGRFGLRTAAGLVAFDAFGDLPLVLLVPDAPLATEPGWPRTFADALVGLKVERVRARRGDRLIALDASSTSRFGVASGYRLVAELVPRYGNLVLLKGTMVVAAAKSFEAGGRTTRTVTAGEPYESPPLPGPDPKAPPLVEATAGLVGGAAAEPARRLVAKALRAAAPGLPVLVADSYVAEAARLPWSSAAVLAEWLLDRSRRLIESTAGEPDGFGDIFVYSQERLVQAHVVSLHQFDALTLTREPALLPALAGASAEQARNAGVLGFRARRAALLARIEKRRSLLARERAGLEADRLEAAELETLRRAGDALYAHHAEVPPYAGSYRPPSDPEFEIALDPELDAKANAAKIFKRYKKGVGKQRHAEQRLVALGAEESAVDDLAWEIERAEPDSLPELREAVEGLERRRGVVPAKRARVERGPLEVALSPGARVLVGRSPRGNAELTFRLARPDDLWFHTRGVPGAHVVLRLDTARAATREEVRAAAALAAVHSKARASDKVEVDYTERKYVRKRPGGAPGLVWYTNARTELVAPREGSEASS
jgi:predicted ribosome quality control (RQC) complex YloA/Tae2 family protein